jgi:RNA polymerase-binding protein DksA
MAERAGAARKATTSGDGRPVPGVAAESTSQGKSGSSPDTEVAGRKAVAAGRKDATPPVTASDREGGAEAGERDGAAKTAKSATSSKSSRPAKATRSATKSVSREEKAITKSAPAKRSRPAADMEEIRVALTERRDELRAEYEQTLAEIADLQRDRFTDSAGDDQADTGTKTFEREQEISLANGILERINQVERALERVAAGNYGSCEKCGNPIPVERLAAFPAATLCIPCKQLEERR